MIDVPDLGPLTVSDERDAWRFTLAAPEQVLLEIPTGYDVTLSENLRDLLAAKQKKPAVFDLQQLPAISSRHLGLMLALRKALHGYCEPLKVIGISETVRGIFEVTHTAQFFELET